MPPRKIRSVLVQSEELKLHFGSQEFVTYLSFMYTLAIPKEFRVVYLNSVSVLSLCETLTVLTFCNEL